MFGTCDDEKKHPFGYKSDHVSRVYGLHGAGLPPSGSAVFDRVANGRRTDDFIDRGCIRMRDSRATDCSIFGDNIAARRLPWSTETVAQVWDACAACYSDLPLYCGGNSKELRRTPIPGLL